MLHEITIPNIDNRFFSFPSSKKKTDGIKGNKKRRGEGNDAFMPITYRTAMEVLFKEMLTLNNNIDILFNNSVFKIDYRETNKIKIYSYDTITNEIREHTVEKVAIGVPLSILKNSVNAKLTNGKIRKNSIMFDPPLPQSIINAINNLGVGMEIKIAFRYSPEIKFLFPNQIYFTLESNSRWMNLGASQLLDTKKNREKLKYIQHFGFPEHTNVLLAMCPPSDIQQIGFQTEIQRTIICEKYLEELYRTFGLPCMKYEQFKHCFVDYKLVIMALDENIKMSYSYTKCGSGAVDIEAINTCEINGIIFVGENASIIAKQMAEGAFETGVNASQRHNNEEILNIIEDINNKNGKNTENIKNNNTENTNNKND